MIQILNSPNHAAIEESRSVLRRYDGSPWVYRIVERVYSKARVETSSYTLCDADLANDNSLGKSSIL